MNAVVEELGRAGEVAPAELTWRLLTGFYLSELRIEGADLTDRTSAVAQLRAATQEATPQAADDLFGKLAELASSYAPAGAEVSEPTLRRSLSGTRLAATPTYARAWKILARLAEYLRARTGFQLQSGIGELELERGQARSALQTQVAAAVASSAPLVVTGEPDVGKSALTLRVADQIASQGAAVTIIGLRDLPATTVELENQLGGILPDVLEAKATGCGRLLVVDGAESVLEGRESLLVDLASAARASDHCIVAVTRLDGQVAVAKALAQAAPQAASENGLELELPGVGNVLCVGDSHVWSWYRGSTVGPYPCMSALLAIERLADQLIDDLGVPLKDVVELLLRDCQNLAMPGLATGLIVRHLESADVLLDRWLVRPEIWQLEFSRAISEGTMHIQGSDSAELVGGQRRRFNFRDVAAEMTVAAMATGDSERLSALGAIAEDLIGNAREQGYEGEDLVAVEGWAAAFQAENYRAQKLESGAIAFDYQHPDKVASGLAESLKSIAKTNNVIRLQARYAWAKDRRASSENLFEDLAIGREIENDSSMLGDSQVADAVAAVAATAVIAQFEGRATVEDDDLSWAADVLVGAATNPKVDNMSFESTAYTPAADRSAAAALPLFLLAAFDHIDFDRPQVEAALSSCTQSLFDEVRAAFVQGVSSVWTEPCTHGPGSEECVHVVAWKAVEAGLRDCRMGAFDPEAQRRLPDCLDPPYDQTLAAVKTDLLLANRLVHPLVAAADAARGKNCIAASATHLLEALYDSDRRATVHWAEEGFGHFSDHQRSLVARALIESAVAGDPRELEKYVAEFIACTKALDQLLRDLALIFTYDSKLRPMLASVWSHVFSTALDREQSGAQLFVGGHWSESALAGLIPTPQLDFGEKDPDAVISRADKEWLEPEGIADLLERWFPLAAGRPKSIDAVVRLVKCAAPAWQAKTGLVWVEKVIAADYVSAAGACWFLPEWLESVRKDGLLDSDAVAIWRRIVDGLASEGDSRALALQQAEE